MYKQYSKELLIKVSNYKDVNDFINNIRDTLSECIENIDETIDNAKILENYNFPHLILKENFILTVESILDDYINLYRKLEIMKLYKLSNKSKDGVILILNFLDKMINNIKNNISQKLSIIKSKLCKMLITIIQRIIFNETKNAIFGA